ncbi:MAG: VOC family protein [Acetobacteraceae bacterium]
MLPDSRIDHVHRNRVDSPSGPAGTALMVSFTLSGRRFLALNGGAPATYTHAVSFQIDCADQWEVDRLWNALLTGGQAEQCGWLRDRWGVPWQIVPTVLPRLLGDSDPVRAGRTMQACWAW